MKSNVGDPKSLAQKPRSKPEALGQVFTPADIARRMVALLGISAQCSASLLDPCVGPATFLRALAEVHGLSLLKVDAFDIDPEMVEMSASWAIGDKRISVTQGDYLQTPLDNGYDFAILNPPYVRQEWIESKPQYKKVFKDRYGFCVPGTANLYVYFILKVLAELKPGGRFSCVIYDSWQSTRYGHWLQAILVDSCEALNIELIPSIPFDGRMIDATIIYGTKRTAKNSEVPRTSISVPKFTEGIFGLSEVQSIFHTKRGLRLKQADFFLSKNDRRELDGGLPFIKKIGLIRGYRVPDDHLETVLLITKEIEDQRTRLELDRRLKLAQSNPQNNVSILTWHLERPLVWAQHGSAPKAPILFNYYLRNRPRHIFNPSRIYADNFYGLTPKGAGSDYAWLAAMNSTLSAIGILENARNQGAGLAKLQLFEYRDSRVVDLYGWHKKELKRIEALGESLAGGGDAGPIIAEIDALIASVLGDSRLTPSALDDVLRDVDRRARRPKN
jgi:adenine-specific DNA-methyltransferase